MGLSSYLGHCIPHNSTGFAQELRRKDVDKGKQTDGFGEQRTEKPLQNSRTSGAGAPVTATRSGFLQPDVHHLPSCLPVTSAAE